MNASETSSRSQMLSRLSEFGKRLACAAGYEQTLQQVCKELVPETADCAILYLRRLDRSPTVVGRHREERMEGLLRKLANLDAEADSRPCDYIGAGIFRSLGELAEIVPSDHLRVLAELDGNAYCVASLQNGDNCLGLLLLIQTRAGRDFDQEQLPFIAELASRAALAIEVAKLREQALRAENRFARFFESAAAGVVRSTLDGEILEANDRFLEMTGFSRADLKSGKLQWDKTTPREFEHVNAEAVRQLKLHGQTKVLEKDYIRKDGSRLPTQFVSVLLPEEGPTALTVVMDESERRFMEQGQQFLTKSAVALAESLDYERTLQVLARLAVPEFADWCTVDLIEGDGLRRIAIEHSDPEKVKWAREILENHPPKKDSSRGVWNVIRTGQPELAPNVTDEMLEAAATDEEHLELLRQIELRSLLIVPLQSRGETVGALTLVSSTPDRYGDRELELFRLVGLRAGVAVDNARLFTAVKEELETRCKTERELRVSEERFRLMADYAPVFIWLSGSDKLTTWFNKPWLEFTGRSMEQELGTGWIENVHPDDLEKCLRVYNEAFDRREPFQMRFRVRRHDGVYRWVLDHGLPLHDSEGAVTGYIGSGIDVTEQIELQEQLESRVRSRTAELADAYEQLETFSYSVSHDLRSPLRTINAASSILLSEHSEELSHEAMIELHRITAATRRMTKLIDDLLEHAHVGRKQLERRHIDIGEIVENIVDEISGKERKIEVRREEGLDAFADPTLVRVALQNLVENAVKFTSEAESPFIEVGLRPGPEQVFYLKDNGVGFDPSWAERIFKPFERGPNAGRVSGTGIGLANTQRVVERHGGKIWAESEPGKGATFCFTLSPERERRATLR